MQCRKHLLKLGLMHCLRAHSPSLHKHTGLSGAYATLPWWDVIENDTPPQHVRTTALAVSFQVCLPGCPHQRGKVLEVLPRNFACEGHLGCYFKIEVQLPRASTKSWNPQVAASHANSRCGCTTCILFNSLHWSDDTTHVLKRNAYQTHSRQTPPPDVLLAPKVLMTKVLDVA